MTSTKFDNCMMAKLNLNNDKKDHKGTGPQVYLYIYILINVHSTSQNGSNITDTSSFLIP